jgi:hypothetical protein
MTENQINKTYTLLSLLTVGIIWDKTQIWWNALVGLLLFMVLIGLLHGLVSILVTKLRFMVTPPSKYPMMFVLWGIILLLYFAW